MSVLFPKVNKPRQWDYRPIYYDPKKDEREKKLAKLRMQRSQESGDKQQDASHNEHASNGERYVSTLHRGSFREAKDATGSRYTLEARKSSRLGFWIALFIMLVMFIYFLS